MLYRTFVAVCGLISVVGIVGFAAAEDGAIARRVVRGEQAGENLLQSDAWRPWKLGAERVKEGWVCDNGRDAQVQRGISQTVTLEQEQPEPVVARAWSRSENVSGLPDNNYSLYLDLVYMDGTHLWGQTAVFATGSANWQQAQVMLFPEKPIRHVTMHLLMRSHSGKAWFRDPELRELVTPHGVACFDGVPTELAANASEGFQVRDVAADSDFVWIESVALDLKLESQQTKRDGAVFYDVTLSDQSGRDRAVTFVYACPVPAGALRWLDDPRRSEEVVSPREYLNASRFQNVGSNGRLSRYPFGCVASESQGVALGIDMDRPVFYRVGFNAATSELFLACDIGLTPEKPTAHLRFCHFGFEPQLQFRGALSKYYALFPEAFRCRTPEQGLWMPFAKISEVEGYEDFGFKFKEGDNETEWDDRHGMVTFRYTEPMTWWMRMPENLPRTYDAAVQYALELALKKGDDRALALFTSGYQSEQARLVARMLDTPWCNGAVWSMNSMPGMPGLLNDFQLKWNAELKDRLYGPARKADLDGEYIDSSEGYVTDELDFARSHFAAAPTPLCFSATTHRPAIFRGLVAHAYVRQIAADIHDMDHLMMANSTPIRLCWLAPYLDVLGNETNWLHGDQWRPMADADLLYRRAMCKAKPYCFLMNTKFEAFSHERVEKYMQRSLAYGMFPGFFSHNASQGHYFTRPELYNRDRPLFKKYVPLCRQVAEAGWEPITRATSSEPLVYVERFGTDMFTVFNDSAERRTTLIQFDSGVTGPVRDLVGSREFAVTGGRLSLELGPEEVALLVAADAP